MSRSPRLLVVATVEAFMRAFLLPHARHFRARGWRVDALARGASSSPPVVAAFDRVWDAGWSRNPLAAQNLLLEPHRVRRLVAEQGYDIVHVHTPVASFVTRWALRDGQGRPCKVAYTAHGFHFQRGGRTMKNAAYRTLERAAARWTDALVVINTEDYAAALGFGTIDPRRVHLLPGIGVDVAAYARAAAAGERERLRAALGVPDEAFLIVMVAEFIPRKRHADLLRAVAAAGDAPGGRAIHLALAGQGPLEASVRELARTLGVAERTHLLGYRDDVPALLRAADLLVLPSVQEGLPRTVLEAMCAGTPVLASDIRGVRDLLADGAGLLVPAGDVEALTEGVRRAASRPEALAPLATAARQRVEAYDESLVLSMHEALYASLFERARRAGRPRPLGGRLRVPQGR